MCGSKLWDLGGAVVGLAFAAGCSPPTTPNGDGSDEVLHPVTLVQEAGQANAADCPNGGVELNYGVDENVNGTLDSDEIDETYAVCNGRDGATSYDDLTNTPDLGVYATRAELAAVATSGDYADLANTPDLSGFAASTDLAVVATTGDYADLTNTPDLSAYATNASLASVATTGAYQDLSNRPALATVATTGSYADLWNRPNLATVASTGEYADLSNRPALAAVATSGNYNDLSNRYTDAQAVAAMAPKSAANPLNHDRYTDGECLSAVSGAGYVAGPHYTDAQAIAAMGPNSVANPLNHDRYTDTECLSAVSDAGYVAGPHYTDAQAVAAMGPKNPTNPLNHDRYTDAECLAAVDDAGYVVGPHYTDAQAVAAMGVKSNSNPLNHNRYTDAETIMAMAAIIAGLEARIAELECPGIENPANGHCYWRVPVAMTAFAAAAACAGSAGHLVTIADANENTFVNTNFADGVAGLDDVMEEGVFRWATGEPVTYTNWAPGEPDNNSGVQDCLSIATSGLWTDDECDAETGRRFWPLCEKE